MFNRRHIHCFSMLLWMCLSLICSFARFTLAEDSVCAEVKIEILQELAFERQGFDARLKIKNGLDSTNLQNVKVEVNFQDEDKVPVLGTSNPNDTSAKFFYRIDSLDGIQNVSGTGTVAGGEAAEVHWLIIPAPGASGGTLAGKRYLVGATVSYSLGGETKSVEVVPDFINVRPTPQLALDYFLTNEIRADDPFTPQVEAPTPFTLGVRIVNSGLGTAKNVTIESAQPRIVENKQGLLIGFEIVSSYIDDQPAAPTLLIPFGDILGHKGRVGRWVLETNLSGRFTEFTARFTHADELGGKLTSLLSRTSAHLLIRDVLVDLPGRDTVRDFLAQDGSAVKVYESDLVDTLATNYTGLSFLVSQGSAGGIDTYTLTLPRTAGPLFIKTADPANGSKEIIKVQRDDSKVLLQDNAWFYAEGNGGETKHYFGLFDVNGGGVYKVQMAAINLGPKPPVLQFIPNRTAKESQRIGFIVEASDPNGTVPVLSVDSLPVGAKFTDRGDGVGIFDWPTAIGQAGKYPLTFRATDGQFNVAKSAFIQLTGISDTDGDGMADDWEMLNFGSLSKNGTADTDGDGLTDKEEWEKGSDPKSAETSLAAPVIISPDRVSVSTAKPELVVKGTKAGSIEPTYQVEVYSDPAYTNFITAVQHLAYSDPAKWAVDITLAENTHYYWRARTRLEAAQSDWSYSQFFVNVKNDPPGLFVVTSPVNGTNVATFLPNLTISNSVDPDEDPLTYDFQIASDSAGTHIVESATNLSPGLNTTSYQVLNPLLEDHKYYWRAVAKDPLGLSTPTAWTSMLIGTQNAAPSIPLPFLPVAEGRVTAHAAELMATASVDVDSPIISYRFELDTSPSFNSPSKIISPLVQATADVARFAVSNLTENKHYYWRIKASDGLIESDWATSSFFVDQVNEAPSTPTVQNPGDGTWIQVPAVALEIFASVDPDENPLDYTFELYGDSSLSALITSSTTTALSYAPGGALINHKDYFWRVRANDSTGLHSGWSAVQTFYTDDNSVDDPPSIAITSPSGPIQVPLNSDVVIRWADSDPDSDAKISLFTNGEVIAANISEDDETDSFTWRPQFVGSYTITAKIVDAKSTVSASAVQGGTVTVVKPETVKDSDGDGIPDIRDNCPFVSNQNQKDRGGLLTKKKDAIGDACQCGDVNGDGQVTDKDYKKIQDTIKQKKPKVTAAYLMLCNVVGSTACDAKDIATLKSNITAETKRQKNKKAAVLSPYTKKLQVCKAVKR